jgi:hypothetical protein
MIRRIIKLHLLIFILLNPFSPLANESLERENQVKNIINESILKWYSNLCASNTEEVVSLYSSKITFLPTSSKILIKHLKGVRNYFIGINKKYKAFKTNKCTLLNPEIILIDNNTVLVTGIDEFEGVIDNENKDSFNIKGRQSFIFTKEKNKWKIIHHHRSRLPK